MARPCPQHGPWSSPRRIGRWPQGRQPAPKGWPQVSPGHGLTCGFWGLRKVSSFLVLICSYVFFLWGGIPPNDLGMFMLFFVLKNVMLTWKVHSISKDCLNRIVASMFYISRRQDVGGV
jgi:hypothetical protein